jgi:hypothetical protein
MKLAIWVVVGALAFLIGVNAYRSHLALEQMAERASVIDASLGRISAAIGELSFQVERAAITLEKQ